MSLTSTIDKMKMINNKKSQINNDGNKNKLYCQQTTMRYWIMYIFYVDLHQSTIVAQQIRQEYRSRNLGENETNVSLHVQVLFFNKNIE